MMKFGMLIIISQINLAHAFVTYFVASLHIRISSNAFFCSNKVLVFVFICPHDDNFEVLEMNLTKL